MATRWMCRARPCVLRLAVATVGLCTVLVGGGGVQAEEAPAELAGHEETIYRLGFGYELEAVPRNTITPEIAVDYADGEILFLAGVSIGWDL